MANNVFSFLAGAVIGAAAYYLLGTEKGKEQARKAADAVHGAAAPYMDKAQDVAEQVRDKANEFADSARESISKGLDKLEEALNKKEGRQE